MPVTLFREFADDHTSDLRANALAPAIACAFCGSVQESVRLSRHQKARCRRCHSPLPLWKYKSLNTSLACATAILMLAVPVICGSFLTTHLLGAWRTSTLASSSIILWQEGWAALAMIVAITVMVVPYLHAVCLTTVLTTLHTNYRPRWLGRLFRVTTLLDAWAMLDICLLALLVAYARLHVSISVQIRAGAVVFALAALLFLLMRLTLNKSQVWQLIEPQPLLTNSDRLAGCLSCGWMYSKAEKLDCCPRCQGAIESRLPGGSFATICLLSAAILLYGPANVYPIATLPINFRETSYTVLGGAIELARSHLLPLAMLVFVASIVIPLLKFAGLSWCLRAARHGSTTHLVQRTRVYRWLRVIGRWSMVDPLTIACFVPVLDHSGLGARAEAAALPFAVVVMLTMAAVELFDSREMWLSQDEA